MCSRDCDTIVALVPSNIRRGHTDRRGQVVQVRAEVDADGAEPAQATRNEGQMALAFHLMCDGECCAMFNAFRKEQSCVRKYLNDIR